MWKGKFVKVDVKKPKETKKVPEKSDTPKKDIVKPRLTTATTESPLYNLSVDVFDKFYEENKDKIKITDTFPINHEALAEWQEALKKGPPILQQLGRYIAIGLKHVSFADFYDSIIRGAYEAVALCSRENRKIILLIDGTFEKSNMWVALLIWHVIKSYVIFVDDGSNNQGWKSLTDLQNILVLHVDDGLFSGQQVGRAIEKIKDALRIKTTTSKLQWMVLVAALSKAGGKYIKSNFPGVLFPTTVIELETIGEIVRRTLELEGGNVEQQYKDFFDGMKKPRFNKLFMVQENKHVIYFDHKLPDALSILIKILAIAPAIDDSIEGDDDEVKISTRSLINRCVVDNYEFYGLKPEPGDYIIKYDEEKVCPQSFYKNIDYTFNDEKVDKKEDSFNNLLQKAQLSYTN